MSHTRLLKMGSYSSTMTYMTVLGQLLSLLSSILPSLLTCPNSDTLLTSPVRGRGYSNHHVCVSVTVLAGAPGT